MRNRLARLALIFGLDLHQHDAQADRVGRVFAFASALPAQFLFVTFRTSARLSSLKNTQGFEFPSCIFSGWMSEMVSVIGPSSRSSALRKLLGNQSS